MTRQPYPENYNLKRELGRNTVEHGWREMELSYVVDYHDAQPRDYWPGPYVAEIREPGLHGPPDGGMQDVSDVGFESLELPRPVLSAGFCEPECANPFLGATGAPEALVHGTELAQAESAFPVPEQWNPYVGHLEKMPEFDPKAWKLGQNDLQ